jgi:dsDNA-specific endonuclease/ATPase MutS2
MTVTRLKRKTRRNKSRAKERLVTISNLRKIVYIKSPYKGVSGEIIEDENS